MRNEGNNKYRVKLYKSGKFWVAAGAFFLAMGGTQVVANADVSPETAPAVAQQTNTQSTSDAADKMVTLVAASGTVSDTTSVQAQSTTDAAVSHPGYDQVPLEVGAGPDSANASQQEYIDWRLHQYQPQGVTDDSYVSSYNPEKADDPATWPGSQSNYVPAESQVADAQEVYDAVNAVRESAGLSKAESSPVRDQVYSTTLAMGAAGYAPKGQNASTDATYTNPYYTVQAGAEKDSMLKLTELSSDLSSSDYKFKTDGSDIESGLRYGYVEEAGSFHSLINGTDDHPDHQEIVAAIRDDALATAKGDMGRAFLAEALAANDKVVAAIAQRDAGTLSEADYQKVQ